MALNARVGEPDPWGASGQAEFRALVRELVHWAGYTSFQQLETGAARRGTSMPVSTANRALNNDRLPTAEFVERIAVACAADVTRWVAARDALADRPYLRQQTAAGAAPDSGGGSRAGDISDICPYPGLAAFGPADAPWFFGREKATAEVLELLAERIGGTGPLMVAGPSGAGKSSLLRAGLLPALNGGRLPGSRSWAQLVFTPTADPVGRLAAQLAAQLPADPEAITAELLGDPGYLAEALRAMSVTGGENGGEDRHGGRVRVILVVDQFEEVFALCSDEPRRHVFINALCAASRADGVPPALVVLGMRADFYDRCAAYPGLVDALRHGQVLLGPMNGAELRDAVAKPAHAVGLKLQPGLVDVVLGELGLVDVAAGFAAQPGALPLLAHTLVGTWRNRDRQVLTMSGYRLTGGIAGAIAKTAERAYQQLSPDRRDIARTVLLRMIQLGDGTADTRRRVQRVRLVTESPDPAGAEAVLETLIAARLLTTQERTVEIVHEAVLRGWPRLRGWLDNDRAGLLVEQRLVAAADVWDREGRHDSDLYRGARLAAVQERVDAADPALPAPAPEFLRAGVEREQAAQRSVLRRTRRLRRLVAVLGCVTLLAAGATAVAVLSRNDIARQRDEGVSREVAGAAVALRVSDPELAAQLALAALRIARTAEARGALMTTLVNLDPERRSDSGSTGAVQTVAFSHDGRLLVAAGRDGTARVWALGDPPSLAAPPIAYLEHPDEVRSAVFNPTDHILVTSGADGLVRLWSVEGLGRDDPPVRELAGPTGARGPLAFSPDGATLATGGPADSTIRLWNVHDLEHPALRTEFVAHQRDVSAVAFSRDGRILATAGLDGTAKLWDVSTPARPVQRWTLDRRAGFVLTVAFSSTDDLLAIGNQDSTATLWEVRNPRRPRLRSVLGGHLGGVAGVAFSPDGHSLATATLDNAARLWNITDPGHAMALAVPLAGDADNLYSAAFRPDNHTLATSSYGQTVRLWETDETRAAEAVCALVAQPLTREQWDSYLHDYHYEPPCPGTAHADHRGAQGPTRPGGTKLIATHSDKCVAIKAAVPVPVAPAYQSTCTRTVGAEWNLRRTVARGGAAYQIRNAGTGMCLDSQASERRVGDARVVVQRPCVEGAPSMLWSFEATARHADLTDGRFRNVEHDECLNINGNAMNDGAPVVRWMCGDDPNGIIRVSTGALGR